MEKNETLTLVTNLLSAIPNVIKCTCECHTNPSIMHFIPCCDENRNPL